MTTFQKILLVTGGAGFIGSNFLRHMVHRYPHYLFINADALTYAGNLANLQDIEEAPNYKFERTDITHFPSLQALFHRYHPTHIIHFAAESHVDRSISAPLQFIHTNVLGTVHLLQLALQAWQGNFQDHCFFHISTDEVYGTLSPTASPFTELHRYEPHSPYSASKASADHFVRAYHDTYGLPTLISNCSNNYGPYQFPEKLIPLCVNNILHHQSLPIYGNGTQVRDWLHVSDHVHAIDTILHKGKVGETYNVGGENELQNIELVHLLVDIVDELLGRPAGTSLPLITYVKDRPGHDTRYAINATKLKQHLGWQPQIPLQQGLSQTIEWYLAHQDWLASVTSGEYQEYYTRMYTPHQ